MIKFLFTFLITLLPTMALAGSPTSNVGSAEVNKGETDVDLRIGFTDDEDSSSNDDRLRLRQHIDHGFTDWYAFRILVSQDKRKGDSLEHAAITLENRFQLIERRDHGWDGGFRILYTHRDGDKTPHEIDVRLLATVPFKEVWQFRTDTILEREVGENAENGLIVEFRNQVTRKFEVDSPYINSMRLGLELFSDIGRLNQQSGYDNQDHEFGPVMKMKLKGNQEVQIGYRAGISGAGSDHSIKLFWDRKF